MTRLPAIYVVEDSDDDFFALRRACREIEVDVRLERARNVAEAREFFAALPTERDASWPRFIFLDLNLPGVDGRQFLQELKSSETFRSLPVVVYSTSGDELDKRFSYENHANAYHQKPFDYDEMKDDLAAILAYWTDKVAQPDGF